MSKKLTSGNGEGSSEQWFVHYAGNTLVQANLASLFRTSVSITTGGQVLLLCRHLSMTSDTTEKSPRPGSRLPAERQSRDGLLAAWWQASSRAILEGE
jgi:hypothetical protein